MNLQKNVPLSKFGSYKIGGPASSLLEIKSIEDLKTDFSRFKKIFILGGGTNVLISDEGFDGLVLLNRIPGIEQDHELLKIGAGVMIDELLTFCIKNSLSGLEWAGGLPGTIGGAVRGNAGAFGGEIKDNFYEVESYNIRTRKLIRRNNKQCLFAYRSSIFKHSNDMYHHSEIITKVVLKLTKGESSEIEKLIKEKIDYRNLKHPMEYPNIGSTFKNIPLEKITEEQKQEFKDFIKNDPFPLVPTTKLLALSGLKGKREGDAQISEKHPNFIVNLGKAKSEDVLRLIELSKKTVKGKWKIDLEEEITYL